MFFRTALHLACAQGKEDIVKFLLANNAKTNLCDNHGRTPLMKVKCFFFFIIIIKTLILYIWEGWGGVHVIGSIFAEYVPLAS